jgi:hypothetical protein
MRAAVGRAREMSMSMNTDTARAKGYSDTSSGDSAGRAIEPWFSVLLSALVPLLGALFVPMAWKTPLHVLGGAICALGLVLLVRHEMAIRRQHNVTDR